jgi:hypothetical protein
LPAIAAPVASAAYSRERDTAIWTIIAAIGATIAIARRPISPPPLRSSRPPCPPKIAPHLAIVARMPIAPAIVAAIDAIRMSRFLMCASSWATTPSTSSSLISSRSPRVTATAECDGLRPVANAFGACSGRTYSFGLGRPARATSRSTIACSRGAAAGSTGWARYIASTMRSENQ